MDNEKVLLRLHNPVDLRENFALIYVWQKAFAQDLRKKYQSMWENASGVSIQITPKN
jgi:hypothetical protein